MQNEISEIVAKEGYFGKVYAGGEDSERQLFINGTRGRYRAYTANSDQVASFLILAPLKSERGVAMFTELELVKPRIAIISNAIGQGRDRNQFYEFAVVVEDIKTKGVK